MNSSYTVSEEEVEALDKMVVKMKKSQKSYRIFRVVFVLLGIFTFFTGAVSAREYGFDFSIVVLVLLAVFELYMGIEGILATTRHTYRRAVETINTQSIVSTFAEEGVNMVNASGEEKGVPWSEFSAYMRVGQDTIWVVNEKHIRKVAVYINRYHMPSMTFDDILAALKESGVKEITLDKE